MTNENIKITVRRCGSFKSYIIKEKKDYVVLNYLLKQFNDEKLYDAVILEWIKSEEGEE